MGDLVSPFSSHALQENKSHMICGRAVNMEPNTEEVLRQRQLAFTGQVMASFSDGIWRCLAAIQALAGRLGDVLAQASLWAEGDTMMYTKTLSKIETQLDMLDKKIQIVNRVAQRMDGRFPSFDPGELVEEAVSLSTRFAHMRGVSLIYKTDQTLRTLFCDPVSVHFLVSMLIHRTLERIQKGGKVVVRAEPVDNGVLIEVEGCGPLETRGPYQPEKGDPYWSIGEQVADDLGGRLQANATATNMIRVSLFLPVEEV